MESNSLDADDVDRPRGILSEADRKYLLADSDEREANYSRQARSLRERSIHERLRHALRDFQILQAELSDDQRDQIFDVPPHNESDRRGELNTDIGHLLQFLYVSMGGQAWFGQVLQRAVANGEVELGHTDHALLVTPRFDVKVRTDTDLAEVASRALDKLDGGTSMMKLDDTELYALSKYLGLAGIDTDAVRNVIELEADLHDESDDDST